MFAFFAYYHKENNKVIITHLPLKNDAVELRHLEQILMMQNRDIKAVSMSLKSFIGGIMLSNENCGGTIIDVEIVPEIVSLLDENPQQFLMDSYTTIRNAKRESVLNNLDNDIFGIYMPNINSQIN